MKEKGGCGILPSQLRKAPEARHVPGEVLLGHPERPLNKAVKVKPELCWRPQSVGNVPTMGWLPREQHIGSGTSPGEVLSSAELEGWSHLGSLT